MGRRPAQSLKEIDLSLDTESRIYLPFSASTRTIWNAESNSQSKIVSGTKADQKFFADILSVRCQTDSRWPDQTTPADEYSDHYCLYSGEEPVGSLGVTRALHGDLFLHEYYPNEIMDAYFDRIVSAYRFRLLPKYRRTSFLSKGTNLALHMIREAWKEHIAKGAGIDMINVEPKYIPYYHRMGYVLCEGYDFICPVFHEPISVMFLCTDPTRESVVQDLIQDRDDHVFLDDVLSVLNQAKSFVPERLAL